MKKIFLSFLLLQSFQCSAAGIAVLEYHQITDSKTPGDTVISPAKFEKEMQYLNDTGYKTLSVDELVSIMKKKTPMPAKAVVITFDDGWTSVLNAVPVLNRFNMKASFWIVSGLHGGDYLTWNQVAELSHNPNFEIEAHSATHPWNPKDNLVTWTQGQNNRGMLDVAYELADPKIAIEFLLGTKVKYIAWPSGYYNQILLDSAKQAGYEGTMTIDEGPNNPGDDPFKIKRLFVDGNCNVGQFAHLLKIYASSQCLK